MPIDVETTVRQILTEQLGVESADLRGDARLVEDLGVDSLDAAELLIAAESELQIEIDEDRFRDARTVDDIVGLVRAHVERRRVEVS